MSLRKLNFLSFVSFCESDRKGGEKKKRIYRPDFRQGDFSASGFAKNNFVRWFASLVGHPSVHLFACPFACLFIHPSIRRKVRVKMIQIYQENSTPSVIHQAIQFYCFISIISYDRKIIHLPFGMPTVSATFQKCFTPKY